MPKLHGNQLYGKFKATLRDSPQNNRKEWVKQGRVSWRVAGMGTVALDRRRWGTEFEGEERH